MAITDELRTSVPAWVFDGLVRGCEMVEDSDLHTDDNGLIWDDEVRKALEFVRKGSHGKR